MFDDRAAGVMHDEPAGAVTFDFREVPSNKIWSRAKEMQHATYWRNIHAGR
jgi:hypothetical protein